MSYRTNLQRITEEPGASYWLKAAVKALDARDAVDALNDAETLWTLQRQRWAALQAAVEKVSG